MRGVQIYRPNSDMTKGWAVQFNLGYDRRENLAIFVEAARQIREKPAPGVSASPFDWDNKIRMMLNRNEMAEIAASIRGLHRKPIKLTHQTTTKEGLEKLGILNLEAPTTDEAKRYGNWLLSLYSKVGTEDKRVNGFVSPAELYQVMVLIDYCLMRNFSFSNPPPRKQEASTSADSGN